MLETDLVLHLQGYGALAALISTRIYPHTLPQEPTLPALTYFRVSTAPVHNHNLDYAWALKRFQFDIYAATYLVCLAVKDALIEAMGYLSYTAHWDNDQDINEPELGRYRLQIDFMLEEVRP
jgi:hypothetical protein